MGRYTADFSYYQKKYNINYKTSCWNTNVNRLIIEDTYLIGVSQVLMCNNTVVIIVNRNSGSPHCYAHTEYYKRDPVTGAYIFDYETNVDFTPATNSVFSGAAASYAQNRYGRDAVQSVKDACGGNAFYTTRSLFTFPYVNQDFKVLEMHQWETTSGEQSPTEDAHIYCDETLAPFGFPASVDLRDYLQGFVVDSQTPPHAQFGSPESYAGLYYKLVLETDPDFPDIDPTYFGLSNMIYHVDYEQDANGMVYYNLYAEQKDQFAPSSGKWYLYGSPEDAIMERIPVLLQEINIGETFRLPYNQLDNLYGSRFINAFYLYFTNKLTNVMYCKLGHSYTKNKGIPIDSGQSQTDFIDDPPNPYPADYEDEIIIRKISPDIPDGDGDNWHDDDDDYNDDDNADNPDRRTPTVSTIGQLSKTYAVTPSHMSDLNYFLWSGDFIDNIQLLLSSPIENILSVKLFPFDLGDISALSANTYSIWIGNTDSETPAKRVPSTYVSRVSGGQLAIPQYYYNFLDYAPFTKIQLFAPFCGFHELDASAVVGKTVKLEYIFDLITGTCVCDVLTNGILIDSYSGTMGIDMPLTSSNRAQFEAGILMSAVTGVASGNPVNALVNPISSAVNGFHTNTQGSHAPNTALFQPMTAFVVIDRPYYYNISTFAHTHGRVSNNSYRIGDLKGFTQCNNNIDLSSITNLTKSEADELRAILSGGFIA